LYPDRARLTWAEGQLAVSAAHLVTLVAGTKGARLAPPATLEYPLDMERSVPQRLSALRTALETARLEENTPV
jgi:hypothetical protein